MCEAACATNYRKFNCLPELEITPVNPAVGLLDQYAFGDVGTKSKLSKEQLDIHRLLIKLPVLYEYFNVHKKIGEGTYSSVYLATYKNVGSSKKFAVKHLTQNFSLPRIQKELKFMQIIGGHDNVVGVLNCLKNRTDDCIVFVMPYLEHRRFSEYVLHMNADELRIYMKNLFIALRRVHAFNVIHRDVKPGNFLYNRETKEFLLVDFGLAQQVDDENKEGSKNIENMPIDYSKRKRSPSDGGNQPNKIKVFAASPLKSRENIMSTTIIDKSNRLADLTSPVATPTIGANVKKTPLKSRSYTSSSQSSSSRKKLFCDDPYNKDSTPSRLRGTSLLKSKTDKLGSTPNDRGVRNENRGFTPLIASKTPSSSFVQVRNSQVVAQKVATCACAGVGRICTICQSKRAMTAPRAGTPGFRPPEVLLKYLHQTTAVDMWAAGVIMLCVLSGCYPFFKSPNDLSALVEIITIFGKEAVERVAAKFGRRVSCSEMSKPIDVRKLCRRMRGRRAKSTQRTSHFLKCEDCKQNITDSGCLCKSDDVQPVNVCSDGDSFPDSAYHLLLRLLDVDPTTRITANEALNHPFISQW